MSFGFSIGDVVLLSQLAYKLYSTLTVGRRTADRDLKELEDTLFGLHCALDHLTKEADNIPTRHGANNDIREKLSRMIKSCGATLHDLDSITVKYREGANPTSNETTEAASKAKPNLAELKMKVKVNWTRIRWDMERQSLREYRDKLQSHMDAINLILTSLIWDTMRRAESSANDHAERTRNLINQSLSNDASLLKLVEEIHAMLLNPPNASQDLLEADKATTGLSNRPLSNEPPMTERGAFSSSSHCVISHENYRSASSHLQATMPVQRSPHMMRNSVAQTAPLSSSVEMPTAISLGKAPQRRSDESNQDISNELTKLNNSRTSIGHEEFERYAASHPNRRIAVRTKPEVLEPDISTMEELYQGLAYIFRSLSTITLQEREGRFNEMVRWIQALGSLANLWLLASSDPRPRNLPHTRVPSPAEVADFAFCFNETIDESSEHLQGLFYEASARSEFDHTLNQLQTFSESVSVEKEIEEFIDRRDEWRDQASQAVSQR